VEVSGGTAVGAARRELAGRVCLVTGASRGAGLAIAEELGRHGAIVYVTGRSSRTGSRTDDLAGTVEDAADAVTAAGGQGLAVRCDHTRDADVDALAGRLAREQGRLDLLVNNVWGGYEQHDGFIAPFHEQDVALRWQTMFTAGVRAQLVTVARTAPLLLARSPVSPRLVLGTVAWAEGRYLGNLVYDMAKAALIRMAAGLAHELRPHGVASLAIAPGFMRTERVMAAHAREPFDLGATESPLYLARAVAALARDPHVMARSGELVTAGELAPLYGFTDVDGRRPPPFRLTGAAGT
jgi:NAD(P)-dependent dehydrogenase (short-subunit alcohol dehydrogenase family)